MGTKNIFDALDAKHLSRREHMMERLRQDHLRRQKEEKIIFLTRIGYNGTKGNPSNKEATTIIFSSFLAGSL
jgi:hypothetical protein